MSSELRAALEAVDFWVSAEEEDVAISHMLIWATVLGAVAATTDRYGLSRD